jgi:hypothetical protein
MSPPDFHNLQLKFQISLQLHGTKNKIHLNVKSSKNVILLCSRSKRIKRKKSLPPKGTADMHRIVVMISLMLIKLLHFCSMRVFLKLLKNPALNLLLSENQKVLVNSNEYLPEEKRTKSSRELREKHSVECALLSLTSTASKKINSCE